MKNLIRLFLILFVAGIAIGTHTSCSEDSDCSIAGRAMINCTLYRMPAPSETILQNDTLDSLTVTALGTDSIIINNQKKVHTLSLPLRFTSDSTVFIFYYAYREDPTLCDTVYIKQDNTPYFESMDCGYSMKQSILGLGHSEVELDSI